MAELTTPSLANMRSMMAELFVWKENETVIREVKTRLCKACNTPPFSGLDAEGCGTLGFCERSPMPSLTCQTSRLTSNEIFPICLCKSWKMQENFLLLWRLWCRKDTLSGKGNTKSYSTQNRGKSGSRLTIQSFPHFLRIQTYKKIPKLQLTLN